MARLKRQRKLIFCMTDDEYSGLERLVETFSLDGARASKSFVIRYALKKLPYQQNFHDALHPASSGLDLQSAC